VLLLLQLLPPPPSSFSPTDLTPDYWRLEMHVLSQLQINSSHILCRHRR
jgi:hypothetical protein